MATDPAKKDWINGFDGTSRSVSAYIGSGTPGGVNPPGMPDPMQADREGTAP